MIETINKLMRVQKQLVQEYAGTDAGRSVRGNPVAVIGAGGPFLNAQRRSPSIPSARAKRQISAILLRTRARKIRAT